MEMYNFYFPYRFFCKIKIALFIKVSRKKLNEHHFFHWGWLMGFLFMDKKYNNWNGKQKTSFLENKTFLSKTAKIYRWPGVDVNRKTHTEQKKAGKMSFWKQKYKFLEKYFVPPTKNRGFYVHAKYTTYISIYRLFCAARWFEKKNDFFIRMQKNHIYREWCTMGTFNVFYCSSFS